VLFQLPFNDVGCNGLRASASVTTLGGDDRVTFKDDAALALACVPSLVDENNVPVPPPALRASLDLGAGVDTLRVLGPTVCPPGSAHPGQSEWSAAGTGGSGDDDLAGGPHDDVLGGGPGLDTVNGGEGDDELSGGDDRDILEGAQDDDTIRGGGGNDAFRGGGGDDLMLGGRDGEGSDTFDGGPGVDTVNYTFASGVSVTIELTNDNPDGEPGEGDAVFENVENVTGSTQADTLTGDGDANVLDGSPGPDRVTGAAGADTLLGGDGDDTIDARDGARDARINCGAGAGDVADADLADRVLFLATRTGGESGCEVRNLFAIDDGPPGRLVGRVLRVGTDGAARARLACPRNARVACRGVLRLRRAKPRRVVASAAYRVARGSTGTIELEVAASLRGRTLQAETVERGVSRKGPRSSLRLVRVR
jgi:Ca2+-binding RTX toxin-like protein